MFFKCQPLFNTLKSLSFRIFCYIYHGCILLKHHYYMLVNIKFGSHTYFFCKSLMKFYLFISDKKFLEFFFRRLRMNNTGKYEKEFPFYSPCGREKNFVRCDDLPIVFTHLIEYKDDENEIIDYLSYAQTGDLLKVKFQPDKICMHPISGRVYHPGPEVTGGVGLVKSYLAIQLSQNFVYKNANTEQVPEMFIWKDKKYILHNEILKKLEDIYTRITQS